MRLQHSSPDARLFHHLAAAGPHPHSLGWYGTASAASAPHCIPGSSLSVASGDSVVAEEQASTKEPELEGYAVPLEKSAEELKKQEHIIHEALNKRMDDDLSICANEADAASALLFATAALRRTASGKVPITPEGQATLEEDEDLHEAVESENNGGDDSGTPQRVAARKEGTAGSSAPFKKRRNRLDRMQPTEKNEKKPLHVSPLPSPQIRTRVAAHKLSKDTQACFQGTVGSSSTSMCTEGCCDSKNAQCLPAPAGSSAAHISPPRIQVIKPHFPTVLHSVLTSPEFAGSVVQWLTDGRGWKILRWDALRRKVLPKYFSHLEDQEGRVGSSVDSFLWHVAAWGFEEVQSGPNVGAYVHEFFVKDSPQLCRSMSFFAKHNECESPSVPPKRKPSALADKLGAASHHHSILQVPSLASSTQSEVEGGAKEVEHAALTCREDPRKSRTFLSSVVAYPSLPGYHGSTAHAPLTALPIGHPAKARLFLNYRSGDSSCAAAERWHCISDSPMKVKQMASFALPGYNQRLLEQRHFELAMPRTLGRHNTAQAVQSGHGALRLDDSSKTGLGEVDRLLVRRESFPVSSRGKGGRSGHLNRVPVLPFRDALQIDATPTHGHSAVEGIPERASMKKTKRKLPVVDESVLSRARSRKKA